MSSKTILAVVIVVIVVAAALGAYFYITTMPPPAPAIKEIKIGLVEPLTGAYAVFGTEAKQAAELVIEHINAEGGIKSMGGAKLKLVVEDSKSSVDGAKLAAERLVSVERVPIMIGAFISRHTLAMAEVTERGKVILVADALIDYLTEKGFKYFFRICPKMSAHGYTAVDFVMDQAKKKGIEVKSIVIINEDSIFGKTGALAIEKRALDYELEVLDRIEYPYDITDMTSIIERIKSLNPDIVFSVPYFTDAVLFAKTAHDLGLKPMFIAAAGGTGYADPDSIKAIGEAVEYYTQTYSYDPHKDTEYNKKFVKEFTERYGKMPTEAGGIIVYSLWTIKEALEKAGELNPSDPLNPDNLRKAFLSLDITSGPAADTYPSGRIKFNDKGDNQYAQAVVIQVINQEPVLVWPPIGAQREPIFPRPG